MANGHEFHLYTYAPVTGVPSEVVIKDANEIVSESRIEMFRSVQNFSDFFRYALLLKKGGWYVDMDTICLKPFDFPSEYVFYQTIDNDFITAGVCKCPPNSPIMQYCYDTVNCMTKEELQKAPFQHIGPDLVHAAVSKFGLTACAPPGITFDPIRWKRCWQVIDPNMTWDLSRSYALHLFHAAWNNGCQAFNHPISPDSNGQYPEGCLYEQLKRRYL